MMALLKTCSLFAVPKAQTQLPPTLLGEKIERELLVSTLIVTIETNLKI